MLYMVMDKNNRMVKVGYTGNLVKRMDMYKCHNPYIELIAVYHSRKGLAVDHQIETMYHHIQTRKGYEFINGTEWVKVEKKELSMIASKGFAYFANIYALSQRVKR